MKQYKVRATRNFFDKKENVLRIGGASVFVCDEERYNVLNEHEAVKLIEVIELEEEKPKRVRKPRKDK